MKLKISLLIISAFIASSTAFSYSSQNILQCEFKPDTWSKVGDVYVCNVKNVKDMDTIDKVEGSHFNYNSNKDVTAIMFRNGKMEKIPKGIDKIFPNLKSIAIEGVGLKELKGDDLRPFRYLQYLFLYGNKITDLESNLFKGNPSLKTISLNNNPIAFIFPDVFSNLYDLNHIDLLGQSCKKIVYEVADTKEKVQKLVQSIESGGCMENDEDLKIIKRFFFTSFNSTSIVILRDIFQSFSKHEEENKQLRNQNVQLEYEKIDFQQQIRELQQRINKLERDNANLKKDYDECNESSNDFKKTFNEFKLRTERKANESRPNAALEKLIELLKFEVQSYEVIIQKCKDKIVPRESFECPACPKLPMNPEDLIACPSTDSYVASYNKTMKDLKKCTNTLQIEKNNGFECEQNKAKISVTLKSCELNLKECNNKPGGCKPSNSTTEISLLRERLNKCGNDVSACKNELTILNRKINQLLINDNACKENQNNGFGLLQECRSRYVHLWEACSRGKVKKGLSPNCTKIDVDYNPGKTVESDFDYYEFFFSQADQCKEIDFNIKKQLEECKFKFKSVNNFVTVLEDILSQHNTNMRKGLAGPNLASCFDDSGLNSNDIDLAETSPFPEIGVV